MQKSDLQTETSSFVDRYPQFVEAIVKQKEDLFWTEKEIDLNKDKHDLRKKLSPAQRHAVSFNQRLFTKYESVREKGSLSNILNNSRAYYHAYRDCINKLVYVETAFKLEGPEAFSLFDKE